MLSCSDLRFRYEGASEDALRGVSLTVSTGCIMGIVGCSGCGKSTLLRCLAGQLVPSSGRLEVDGITFGNPEVERRAYRLQVGLVEQLPEEQFFARTVRDDVAFGPRNLALGDEEVGDRIDWALGSVGLDAATFADRNPFALSGGEARRVAIAGILALRPCYLLLDEPTAGLDPRETRRLLALLMSLAADGMGIVLVSHDVDVLARSCTDVALMSDGELTHMGPVREVLGDADGVRACGLLPSAGVELADRLRKRGIPLPAGLLTAEELADCLCREGAGA